MRRRNPVLAGYQRTKGRELGDARHADTSFRWGRCLVECQLQADMHAGRGNTRKHVLQDEETRPSSSVIIVAQRVASMRPQIALLPEAGALPRLEPRLGPHLARLGVWRGRGLFSFFLVVR